MAARSAERRTLGGDDDPVAVPCPSVRLEPEPSASEPGISTASEADRRGRATRVRSSNALRRGGDRARRRPRASRSVVGMAASTRRGQRRPTTRPRRDTSWPSTPVRARSGSSSLHGRRAWPARRSSSRPASPGSAPGATRSAISGVSRFPRDRADDRRPRRGSRRPAPSRWSAGPVARSAPRRGRARSARQRGRTTGPRSRVSRRNAPVVTVGGRLEASSVAQTLRSRRVEHLGVHPLGDRQHRRVGRTAPGAGACSDAPTPAWPAGPAAAPGWPPRRRSPGSRPRPSGPPARPARPGCRGPPTMRLRGSMLSSRNHGGLAGLGSARCWAWLPP